MTVASDGELWGALPTLLLLAGALTARSGRQRQLGRRALGRARDAAGRAFERAR